MEWREFITLLGGGARLQRVGMLMKLAADVPFATGTRASRSRRLQQNSAFTQKLKELGWADGRNVRIDYRWASGDVGRMRTFAKELVGLHSDVIFALPLQRLPR